MSDRRSGPIIRPYFSIFTWEWMNLQTVPNNPRAVSYILCWGDTLRIRHGWNIKSLQLFIFWDPKKSGAYLQGKSRRVVVVLSFFCHFISRQSPNANIQGNSIGMGDRLFALRIKLKDFFRSDIITKLAKLLRTLGHFVFHRLCSFCFLFFFLNKARHARGRGPADIFLKLPIFKKNPKLWTLLERQKVTS